ncbi:BolA family protein [Aestuariispira ectoiniformans]|uniref:BolA family protein n=1 Tax=Aestuariispira ectoiniformans TaxID=2775080 RepID=UPI00223C2008|nr:BolA family protein [Aestuariispira ectoiniformans]
MTVEQDITRKLTEGLSPAQLAVENESHLHAGHAGSPGTGSSHFRVVVVSDKFDGLNRVARQRLVYDLLKVEMAGPVHALALQTLTPAEAAA